MNQEMERQKSVELTKKLADMEGRRPRLYMADMEEDHSKKGSWLPPPSPMEAGTWM